MMIPLDALIRRASRIARQMFDKTGEVTAFWIVETATGEQATIVTPMAGPSGISGPEFKAFLAEKMRELFREKDVVRYVHANETWTLGWVSPETVPTGSLAHHPDRREIVSIAAEDGREYLWATHDIIRPIGSRAYLSKLSEIDRPPQAGGLFTGLLPSAAEERAQ